MSRVFKGQVHVRVPPQIHEEIAKEAFEKGTSISGIFSQALLVRSILKDINPWKSIEAIWEANKGVDESQLQDDIEEAIKAVRKTSRRG